MDDNNAQVQIVSQQWLNNLNTDGSVTPGVKIQVRDLQTGVTFPIFLAEDKYSADNVKALIQYNLNRIREVHGITLG